MVLLNLTMENMILIESGAGGFLFAASRPKIHINCKFDSIVREQVCILDVIGFVGPRCCDLPVVLTLSCLISKEAFSFLFS